MKTNFFMLLCAFFLIFAQTASAKCTNCNPKEALTTTFPQVIYLKSEQIAFHESKIYVQLAEGVLIVPAIYSDQNGLYIRNEKQPGGRCEPYEWKCPKCKICNDFAYFNCQSCGTEMP